MLTDTAAVLAVMRQAAESVPDGALWLQTSMDTDLESVAGLAEEHGITFVDCPVLGTRETAKQGRLVVLASAPGDALDRAQPVFDAIGSKTVRLGPEAGGVSRMKLVASAWTVAIASTIEKVALDENSALHGKQRSRRTANYRCSEGSLHIGSPSGVQANNRQGGGRRPTYRPRRRARLLRFGASRFARRRVSDARAARGEPANDVLRGF
jgi:3-hydroxyisobutyrate dehydrogenase-like beta-hydroxyacid dehydrogenase